MACTPRKRRRRTPKLRLHKSNDQAFVEACGERFYFGKWGKPETQQRYHRWVAEFVANDYRPPVDAKSITVVELIARFWGFASTYYRAPDGSPSRELDNFRLALRPVKDLYSTAPVNEFGPRALKAVRQRLIDAGGSRRYVNKHVSRIRLVFRWGVEEELVPASVSQALDAVAGLRRGRTEARETEGVRPVLRRDVLAIRPHVSRQVWALVELQLLTGARPGELLPLRPVDLDTMGDIWLFRPVVHKNAYRGHERTIYLNGDAQEIIRPFLASRSMTAPLFSPVDAERERRAKAHAERKTPISCGNRPGTNRKRSPQLEAGEVYSVASYRRAIHRACAAAGVEQWSPHRLRHTAATAIRKEHGIEAAQIMLGHKRADVTQVYAHRDEARALEIVRTMRRIGGEAT